MDLNSHLNAHFSQQPFELTYFKTEICFLFIKNTRVVKQYTSAFKYQLIFLLIFILF